MTPATRLGVLLSCIGLAACASPAAPIPTTTDAARAPVSSPSQAIGPSAAPSPSQAAAASVAPRQVVVGGARPVTVHLPPDAGTEPAPLLMVLHGFGVPAYEVQAYLGMDRVAAERGVVIVYPEGTRDRDGNPFWNATDACCNLYASDVDDVAYLAGLADEISRATPIDPKRVYLVGVSNGGFMSHRMACDQADVFAAVVSLGGATFDDEAQCAPSEPVAVLEIHGSRDETVSFEGGKLDLGRGTVKPRTYPGAKATAMAWAVSDGCAPAFDTLPEMLDVDAGIDGPNGPNETKVEIATGCDPGGHVELWTIIGGFHLPNLSPSFSTEVIDFLLAHPEP